MKLQFLSRLSFGLVMLLVVSNLQAQVIKELPPVTVRATTNVSKKVADVFQTDFRNAVNPKWYKINKNYVVDFINNNLKNKALYQKNGYMIYHISYGVENNLPKDIKKMVKSNYVDYNITKAINVHQDKRDIWVINLEDNQHFILVRVEDGALEEVGNYQNTL